SEKRPALIRSIKPQMPHFFCSGMCCLRRDLHELDPCMGQEVGDGVELVFLAVEHVSNSRVDQDLHTVDAGSVRDVNVRIADRGAVASCLRDRIDLSMNRAKAVLFDLAIGIARLVDETSDLGAMGQTCG